MPERTPIEEAVATLTDRERQLLETLHGLDGEPGNMSRAMQTFNVGRWRIEQLEAKVFRKLRRIDDSLPGRIIKGNVKQTTVVLDVGAIPKEELASNPYIRGPRYRVMDQKRS